MIAPKETKSLQNELQEDLANNNQPTVIYETNSYGKNQIANQAKVLVNETIEKLKEQVLVDETIEKVKEPMILIKPDAFAVAKLDDQLAASSKGFIFPDHDIDTLVSLIKFGQIYYSFFKELPSWFLALHANKSGS